MSCVCKLHVIKTADASALINSRAGVGKFLLLLMTPWPTMICLTEKSCRLVGVGDVSKTGDRPLDWFLRLPTDVLGLMTCEFKWLDNSKIEHPIVVKH